MERQRCVVIMKNPQWQNVTLKSIWLSGIFWWNKKLSKRSFHNSLLLIRFEFIFFFSREQSGKCKRVFARIFCFIQNGKTGKVFDRRKKKIDVKMETKFMSTVNSMEFLPRQTMFWSLLFSCIKPQWWNGLRAFLRKKKGDRWKNLNIVLPCMLFMLKFHYFCIIQVCYLEKKITLIFTFLIMRNKM